MFSALNKMFLPVLEYIFRQMEGDASSTGAPTLTEEQNQNFGLQKCFFLFLNNVALNGLSAVLLSPTNVSHLGQLLKSIANALATIDDYSTQKMCASTLSRLAKDWLTDASPAGLTPQIRAAFVQFACSEASNASFTAIASPGCVRNAAGASLLLQIVELHAVLLGVCGDVWVSSVRQFASANPQSLWKPHLMDQYCVCVREHGNKAQTLRKSFVSLFL